MRSFLGALRDSASAYSPPPVQLGVSGPRNLKWTVVGRSDGITRLLMYRGAPVYDPETRTRLTVRSSDVTVTDRAGTRVVGVAGKLVSLRVR